jgi:hypothetical protein
MRRGRVGGEDNHLLNQMEKRALYDSLQFLTCDFSLEANSKASLQVMFYNTSLMWGQFPPFHLELSKVCGCVRACIRHTHILTNPLLIRRLSHITKLILLSMSPNNPTLVDLPMCWLKVHFDNHLYQFSFVGYKYIKSFFSFHLFPNVGSTHISKST